MLRQQINHLKIKKNTNLIYKCEKIWQINVTLHETILLFKLIKCFSYSASA